MDNNSTGKANGGAGDLKGLKLFLWRFTVNSSYLTKSLWQISGRRDLPFEQQVELDKQYIKSQNILLDIIILLKTIPAVLTGRGAY